MFKSENSIQSILESCRLGNRDSQKKLYQNYFGYSYNICLRYAKNKNEANQFLNAGWLKVFSEIKNQEGAFEDWLKNKFLTYIIEYHQPIFQENTVLDFSKKTPISTTDFPVNQLTYQVLTKAIQALPTRCRVIFCLVVIEKFSFSQIGNTLNIEDKEIEYYLAEAKLKLKKDLHSFEIKKSRY